MNVSPLGPEEDVVTRRVRGRVWKKEQASVLVLDRQASRRKLADGKDGVEWDFSLKIRLSLTCHIYNKVLSERTMSTVCWDL